MMLSPPLPLFKMSNSLLKDCHKTRIKNVGILFVNITQYCYIFDLFTPKKATAFKFR